MLLDILSILITYTGFGFLVSRFLKSNVRNSPLLWLCLTIVLLPVWVALQALALPVSHAFIFVSSGFYFIAGILIDMLGKKVPVFSLFKKEGTMRRTDMALYTVIFGVFLCFLITAKLALLRSVAPTILDDVNNVNKMLSVGFDLDAPRFFHMPVLRLSYYYYDFVLPALTWRTTSFTAQQSLFIHNVLQYIAIFSFLTYTAVNLFAKRTARLLFILGGTFLGGLDYFVYKALHLPMPGHLEWWLNDSGIPKNFSVQMSSMFTLYLWVPQHLMAGMLALAVMVVAAGGRSTARRIVIAILFAAMLGFSTFVFFTAAISYMVVELLLLHSHPWTKKEWLYFPLVAAVFGILTIDLFGLYSGREGVILFQPKVLEVWAMHPDTIPGLLKDAAMFFQTAFNYATTQTFLLFVDAGFMFVFAVAALLCTRWSWWKSKKAPGIGVYATVMTIMTLVILSFLGSINWNDLYMRGIIVAQMGLLIGFAMFFEKGFIRSRILLAILCLLIPLHLTNFYVEWKGRSDYHPGEMEAAYIYLRGQTPKNSVVYTDANNCGEISYRGNRLCMNRMSEVDLQYAKTDDTDTIDYHDPNALADGVDFERAYFMSRSDLSMPHLRKMYEDDQFRIYAIIKP